MKMYEMLRMHKIVWSFFVYCSGLFNYILKVFVMLSRLAEIEVLQ